MGLESVLTPHEPDLADVGAFRLLHALLGWLVGEGSFPHPPSDSTQPLGGLAEILGR